MITEEEFEAWRDNPVTQWVLSACRVAAEDAKALWEARSWEAGEADWKALTELRARAATYNDVISLNHADVKAALGENE